MVSKSAHKQERISAILNRCLDLIESGAGTVESVIALYPEFGEALRPPLEAAQWLFSRSEVLNPRPGFVKLSRRRLVDRFQSPGSYAAPGSLGRGRFTSISLERRLVIQYSALLTLTAVLLFVGYTSTAFIVQRSIPGDPLYQLKLTQEDYRLALSRDDAGDAYLRIEYAHQRLIEMQKLIEAGREIYLDETLEDFVYQMNAASTAIAGVALSDQEKADEVSSFLTATLSAPIRSLAGVLDVAVYAVDPAVLALLNAFVPHATQPVPAVAWVVTSTPSPTATPPSTLTPTPTFSFTATATSTSASSSAGQPTSAPTSTPPPTQAPPQGEPTLQPTSTPRPRSQPTATPTPKPSDPPPPTAAPTDTPAPPPTSTPQPTSQPTSTPLPTKEPTNTPLPTKAPTSTPLPTKPPTNTPQPQPTDEPEPTPEPTVRNWKTPKPTSFP
jgi:hypothetical protein